VLSELVARFNSAPPEARENGFEQWLWRELDRLDAARLRAAPGPGSRELSQRVDDWLQSAGDVGGPEQEQDPTRRPGQRGPPPDGLRIAISEGRDRNGLGSDPERRRVLNSAGLIRDRNGAER
jgi:hypothetical protein